MPAQIYTFKITYVGCEDKIWRTAVVSSNYTLAKLGYLVLATFETMAYHLFEMKFKDTIYVLSDEDLDYTTWFRKEKYDLLFSHEIGSLDMHVGDVIKMTYDYGCEQIFKIVLLEIDDMPEHQDRAYPMILDGAGRGIIDDMSAFELLEIIKKIDSGEHSEIIYPYDDLLANEWDYRKYSLDCDNTLLKGEIDAIRIGYELPYDEHFD